MCQKRRTCLSRAADAGTSASLAGGSLFGRQTVFQKRWVYYRRNLAVDGLQQMLCLLAVYCNTRLQKRCGLFIVKRGLPAGGSPVQCLAAAGEAAPHRHRQHHHPISIPKAGGDPSSCSSLRGIVLWAALEQRLSDWAEASSSRAEGQFGSRRKCSTARAAFVLRALRDQHRSSGKQSFACFDDFQQAYNTVPRTQLWEKLHAAGLGGEWLRAMQALYADVTMAVRTAESVAAPFRPV